YANAGLENILTSNEGDNGGLIRPSYDGGNKMGDSPYNPIRTYLNSIGRIPLLTKDEEIEIAKNKEYAKERILSLLIDYDLEHCIDKISGFASNGGASRFYRAERWERLCEETKKQLNRIRRRNKRIIELKEYKDKHKNSEEKIAEIKEGILNILKEIPLKTESIDDIINSVAEKSNSLNKHSKNQKEYANSVAEKKHSSNGHSENRKEYANFVENLRLAQKKRQGYMNDMIEANLRLVVSVAKGFMRYNYSFDELIEEGNLGLMTAVDQFDYKKGYKFSTYAPWWIMQKIIRGVYNIREDVTIPIHMWELICKYKKAYEKLTQQSEDTPAAKEIAKEMKVSIDQVYNIQKIIRQPISFNEPVGEDGEGEFGILIKDERLIMQDEIADKNILKEKLPLIVANSSLTKQEKEVINYMYLRDGYDKTFEEASNHFKLSRQRADQIQKSACRKLKLAKGIRELKGMEDKGIRSEGASLS
ncbi:sigma-70 family RNA polymerase sigma factor, partial [Candidatus Pacearchaeota archaeon]|nr:sigma-70 family RNA polymerase sigma factor [Candidatus Pacearchaeota archaeon]